LTGAVKPAEISMPSRRTVLSEACQRKRDAVHAGTQLLDFELARAVADGRAGLLNQDRARGLNRDPREDGAAAVPHDAGNGAKLGKAEYREEEHCRRGRHDIPEDPTHTVPSR
jgi:hypothetical protein